MWNNKRKNKEQDDNFEKKNCGDCNHVINSHFAI